MHYLYNINIERMRKRLEQDCMLYRVATEVFINDISIRYFLTREKAVALWYMVSCCTFVDCYSPGKSANDTTKEVFFMTILLYFFVRVCV